MKKRRALLLASRSPLKLKLFIGSFADLLDFVVGAPAVEDHASLFMGEIKEETCCVLIPAETIISNETDEERTCLLGGGAGRSSDRSSFRVIDRAKGVILPLDLGEYRFYLLGECRFDRNGGI